MKSRIVNIMNILLEEDRFFSVKELSLKLEVSEKTIKSELNRFIEESDNNFIEEDVAGYKVYPKYRKDSEIEKYFESLDRNYMSETDREMYIIKRLLLNESYIKLEMLADELYISIPTINRVFKKVKKVLDHYEIKVICKPNYGVCVEGQEVHKRLCYTHCLASETNQSVEQITAQCGMESKDYYYIDYSIRKALALNSIDITEVGIRNLIIHILYALKRMENGNFIHDMQLQYSITEKEVKTASMIIEKIQDEYKLIFPPTEIDYILIHLMSKRANKENVVIPISKETEDIVYYTNHKIFKNLGFDFRDDLQLLSMLSLHIEPMLSRIKYKISLPNPALKKIKAEYPNAYECAVIAAGYIKETLCLAVSDDELGYLTLHYNLALERTEKEKYKKKFLVVCGSGAGTAMLLENKLQKKFFIDKESIILCSLRELLNKDLDEIDYIISTVDIPFKIDKKIIYIEDVLSDFSLNKISDVISLLDYVEEDMIYLNQDYKTKEEVLDFLCNEINDKEIRETNIKSEVWKRELLSTTDIGNLVAIPHPFSRCTKETIFSICILKKAISWGKSKVKFIFLVSFSEDDLDKIHGFNEVLFGFIMDTNWIAKLDSVKTITELRKILI